MANNERERSNRVLDVPTLPEAARRAALGLRQLRRARDRGELAHYRIGGWDRVRWRDVITWLEAHREPPRSGAVG